jgi:hypothetical protein
MLINGNYGRTEKKKSQTALGRMMVIEVPRAGNNYVISK